ncbi:MAG: rhodanese-like domain-containing protein [Bacteroidota bacterium]
MKKLSIYVVAVLISIVTLFSSFTPKNEISNNPPLNTLDEFETLVNYLEENGNFINSDAAPAIILADEVKKNLKNSKYLVVDVRSETWFEYGHIKNAVNVKTADLLTYFETKINSKDYDKIVLVCYSGQSAAYFTSLLRLAGFDNAYSMKWGMSSWRADFAENSWEKNVKNDFASKLETTDNAKPAKGSHPVLNTGKTEGKDILRVQLEKAFATPYKESIIKSADVFATPGDYFTINYCAKDRYDKGHIPGAIQYQPKSLASTNDLYTLPVDKRIAVYGLTGQNTAYVVAYLDVLGYDAGNIAYGANSFMTKELKANGWDAFTKKQINMYPVVE